MSAEWRWRPILTAPKDGTAVIIAVGKMVGEASYWGDGLGWVWAGNSGPLQSVPVLPDLWTQMPVAP